MQKKRIKFSGGHSYSVIAENALCVIIVYVFICITSCATLLRRREFFSEIASRYKKKWKKCDDRCNLSEDDDEAEIIDSPH